MRGFQPRRAVKLLPEYGRNAVPEEDLIDQSLRFQKAFFIFLFFKLSHLLIKAAFI